MRVFASPRSFLLTTFKMLHITWMIVFSAIAACLSPDRTGEELGALSTPAPIVIELRKRYTIYVPVYYYPDWTAVTTCGIIPYALASQNGLYGTGAATVSTPYSITCDCLCAHAGNYLGCVDVSTGSVATTCTDYTTSPDYCGSDQPCYWDLHCKSAAPFCNENIYSGSITQFTCGSIKHAPITVSEAVSMTPYVAVLPNTTTTSSSTTSTAGSTSEPSSIAEVLRKVGLSIGALAGICAGALALCCASCCGFFWWRSRRATKAKYASSPYTYQNVQYQPPSYSQHPSQQPLMGQNQQYHQQQYPQYQYRRQ